MLFARLFSLSWIAAIAYNRGLFQSEEINVAKRIAAKITGVAGFLPPRVATNADLEKIVETSDE